MPTVGWIQETAWNRHSDAFPYEHDWKRAPVFCPICRRSFSDPASLSSHLGIDHPLALPMMRIGSEIGFTEFTVRDRQMLHDMEVLSTTAGSISVNGAAAIDVEPKHISANLAKRGNGHFRVLLRNARAVDGRQATTELTIHIIVPDDTALREIDRCFGRLLAVEHPLMAGVDEFLRVVPQTAAELAYAGALADYVVGVLIKEQDRNVGTIAPFDAFSDKFAVARRVLVDFATPLAQAIVAAIDFNLNRFEVNPRTTVPALATAHQFFASLSVTGRIPPNAAASIASPTNFPACPVDDATSAILVAMSKFPQVVGIEEQAASLPGIGKHPLSEFDLAKIATLKAGSALLLGKKSHAIHHLRRVAHDFHFGAWAKTQLENFSGNE